MNLKQIRQLHLYLGTLFAPAIIFFAFTGALQTFGLHETPRGSTSPRPAWISKLAEIHKNQRIGGAPEGGPPKGEGAPSTASVAPQSTPQRPAAPSAEKAPPGEGAGPRRGAAPSWPLKWFILLMSIGLISTTLLGIYMSFKYNRDRRVVWGLLALGIVLPVILLYL